jgi:branched-chain amino acid transport system substrate-binding protein
MDTRKERKMESLTSAGSRQRVRSVTLGLAVGLAVLLLIGILQANGSDAISTAPAVAAREGEALTDGSVITIGLAAAMSGGVESLGWRQANAVQLAISQTNAAGGIDVGGTTYEVVLVTADSACDDTLAEAAAHALLDAGAVAVVGHTCSNASGAAQPIYNGAGVPMVSPSSSSLDLTEQGYTTTFRNFPRDDASASMLATHFRRWLRLDEVAVVELSGVWWAPPQTAAFSETFTSLGGTIVSRATVASTDEYTAALTAIKAEDPQGIYYANEDAGAAGLLSRTTQNLGMGDVDMAWDLFWAGEEALGQYAAAAAGAAEGDHAGINARGTEAMPGYDALNAAYQAAGFSNYGDEPQMWGAFAYDAANIVMAAIDRADSTHPTAIRDGIAATSDYDGVVGVYEGFDEKGDVMPQWAWVERHQNGEWMMVRLSHVFLPLVLNME